MEGPWVDIENTDFTKRGINFVSSEILLKFRHQNIVFKLKQEKNKLPLSTDTSFHRSKPSVKIWSQFWTSFTSAMLSASARVLAPTSWLDAVWPILADCWAFSWSIAPHQRLLLLMHSGPGSRVGGARTSLSRKKTSSFITSLDMWVLRIILITDIRYSFCFLLR